MQYHKLEKGKIYGVPIPGGYLRIDVSIDPDYPGVDIELIPDENTPAADLRTKPRVVIESPVENTDAASLRALIWANPRSEDYSDEVRFEMTDMTSYLV